MIEFGFPLDCPTILWCDNQSAIHISRNLVEHQNTKHIELHMHFICQLIQDGVISLEYIPIDTHVVDIVTKTFCITTLSSVIVHAWGYKICPIWFSLFPHFFMHLYMGTFIGYVAGTHFAFHLSFSELKVFP